MHIWCTILMVALQYCARHWNSLGLRRKWVSLCKSGSPKADDGHNGDPLGEPNPCPCQHRLCPIVKMLLTPALTSGTNLSIIFIWKYSWYVKYLVMKSKIYGWWSCDLPGACLEGMIASQIRHYGTSWQVAAKSSHRHRTGRRRTPEPAP